jgi:hypothetical protein
MIRFVTVSGHRNQLELCLRAWTSFSLHFFAVHFSFSAMYCVCLQSRGWGA